MTIRSEFAVHKLNEAGLDKAGAIAEVFSEALDKLDKLIPKSREHSLMVTEMQKASFFAKRAIACDPANAAE